LARRFSPFLLAVLLAACAAGAIRPSGGPEDGGADGAPADDGGGGGGDGGAGEDAGRECEDPDATELCNGADDDCDGSVDEGCDCEDGDTQACWDGTPETRGVGACADGTQTCAGGAWGPCTGAVEPGEELCDGIDDDCDPGTEDGAGDPSFGTDCDGDDSDLCREGQLRCVAGQLACSDETASTTDACNGADDDCDLASADGAEDPEVGIACDGADGDLCAEGAWRCAGGELECSDETTTTVDACNGVDDDCDAGSADGSEDVLAGTACDGADTDLCTEGTWSCGGGALSCSDATGSTVDLCNGADDDCDPLSADGAEDPAIGPACDGGDSDRCNEGVWVCSGGGPSCNDATGGTVDLCNGLDDDCDAGSADGAEDPLVGTACDGNDTDSCREGTWSCNGGLTCGDATGSTSEVCAGDGSDEDCDGSIDEGFPRNDDPLCADGVFDLGFVSGDTGAETATDSFFDEEWDLVTITEDSGSLLYLSATVELWSPPGVDFDLYVYCLSCGGALAGSSTVGGLDGHWDVVDIRREDTPIVTDDFDVIVEVRHWDSTMCAYWQLTVTGDTLVADTTCN